jgi:hypothetical protein
MGEQTSTPVLIDNRRGELKMTMHLAALVKRVVELHDAGLRACQYAEEFTLWWIRPLCHRDKLAYECMWFADPSHEPAASKIFSSIYCC